MDMRRGRVPLGFALLGALALSGCGRDAESAGDLDSVRLLPSEEADVAVDVAVEDLSGEPAAEAVTPPAPAPAASPAPRPQPRPAQQQAPIQSPAPDPVDPRPDTEWTPMPAPEARAEVRALAAGRTLELRMETALSTEVTRAGENFYATVSEDVLGSGGEVLVPMGSRVRGRVVESRESPGADEPAVIRLEVESVTVGGAARPVLATVVEVDMKTDARDSTARTAAKVGAGTAAGAVVGRILGRDTRSTIGGAAAGTVAGAAVAAATRDGHASIEPGARMVIRLDDRLVVDD